MTDNKIIVKYLDSSTEKLEFVYEYINTSRYQDELIKDYNLWNQICSSLYVINDTILAIKSYLSKKYPKDIGRKYLYTYGILQALFTQQDAVINLTECFNVETKVCDVFREIRNLRNISIGHPTKLERREGVYYGYISRITLSKFGFELYKTDQVKKRDQFITVKLVELIKKQAIEINTIISSLSEYLIELDTKHKCQYKENKMENVFPDNMRYYFEKIGEGLYSSDYVKDDFALSMLNCVKQHYDEFKQKLIERKEFSEYIECDWNQYNHALEKVEGYLKKNDKFMNGTDARIYLFYLREVHKSFVAIAKEIDEEYEKISNTRFNADKRD
ncbi:MULTISPECIES: hypothetical protein [unclassified Treponema]|uniref:hypothetical protein n=2 Tax=unclassified Treponema TaxID=2638727 RepID=UPI0020A4DC97|nr:MULTISPECIES: hypothetical protein [unclassified Treponema]UTC67822.1 hypothetical protein E4O06_03955 [Treponema sp. OMZ 789]UTC67881.1 hypothetical protein E4O06_04300 [Treponema sp. OMZ 789]UTC70547.1 hypothetical protein E4O01_03945 [Treponema sp. OMZ 790]UTC73316.1 hypothetical protein E4O02_04455 [Treponema sp. OMZ 791]